jgi:serine/threonine-protein kinase
MEGMPMPGTALPAIGDEIAGKYRIESVLGQGGMGAVFAARNGLTGKRVAIKWLLPEHAGSTSRERLLREAQIACSIEHPNVVDIYDVGEHQGGLFLVMEYLRGQPLSDVLAERGRLDPEELIALLVPAMRGVHAAHMAGVVHRDLKPENIILSELDGQIVPKVVDFGVSKSVGTSGIPHSSLTRTGALVGTPHYMALEQVDGTNQVDGRTDVYGFGVLLYRALTGHFPFDGSSLGEVILKIGTKDPVPMRILRPDLPAELDAIVLRALYRDRNRRFGDLEDFARALLPFAPGVRLRDTADTTGRFRFNHSLLEVRNSPSSDTNPFLRDPRGTLSSKRTPSLGLGGDSVPSLNAGTTSAEAMLGAAVSVNAAVARPTPVGPGSGVARSRVGWAMVGLVAVALLGLGFWIMGRQAGNVAEAAWPKASPAVPATLPAAARATLLPADTRQVAPPQAEMASTKVEPAPADDLVVLGSDAVPPSGPDLQKSSDEPAPDAIMEPVRAKVPALPDRVKRARPPPPAKARPVKLIPGDRTKGLSVDEF